MLSRRYPSLFPYGDRVPRQLSEEEERTAPFEARLESAWAILVTLAISTWRHYKDREKACVGIEDAMQNAVIELIQKDSRWDPDRGRYATFAKYIVRQSILSQRRHARTVTAPPSPYSVVRKYEQLLGDGTLGANRERTLDRVKQAIDDQDTLPPAKGPLSDPDTVPDAAIRREELSIGKQEIIDGLKRLQPIEAYIVACRQELMGARPKTDRVIARLTPGVGINEIGRVGDRACQTLMTYLRRRRNADPTTEGHGPEADQEHRPGCGQSFATGPCGSGVVLPEPQGR